IVFEIFVDLRLLLADGWLVDRELDLAMAALHHLRHQRRIFRADRLIGEVDHLFEAEDILVELDPVVHLAQLDIAYDVVNRRQADATRLLPIGRLDWTVAWEKDARVVLALDKAVERLTIGIDGGALHLTIVVLRHGRLNGATRATSQRLLIRLLGIGHRECNILDAIAVQQDMLRNRAFRLQSCRQHKANLALLQDITGAVAHPGLQARIGYRREAKCFLVENGCLPRIANVELDMVPSLDGHEILLSHTMYTSE